MSDINIHISIVGKIVKNLGAFPSEEISVPLCKAIHTDDKRVKLVQQYAFFLLQMNHFHVEKHALVLLIWICTSSYCYINTQLHSYRQEIVKVIIIICKVVNTGGWSGNNFKYLFYTYAAVKILITKHSCRFAKDAILC